MSADSPIRDLLYFDFEKAVSLWSQFEEGLLERTATTEESTGRVGSGASVGIPKLIEAKLDESGAESRSVLKTHLLHHDLLNKLEAALRDSERLVDLRVAVDPATSDPEEVRSALGRAPYLKAEGWAVIEDYRRIKFISERFNQITDFIAECGVQAAKKSPAFLEMKEAVAEAETRVQGVKDRNEKARQREQLKHLKQQLQGMVQPQLTGVEEWLLDGIRFWIETFMPNRINFRIYPFESCPSFQVLCNLKHECFVDQDLEHLLYGYGMRPNLPLGVMGLITSLPPRDGEVFDPLSEFESDAGEEDAADDKVAFEHAFRRVFHSMDGIEAFMRYARYPNVGIHPIAVFRPC